jgi:hypothetical protein
VARAGGVWWRVAGAGGVWLEQACNRLEQDTLAGARGVWLEQEAWG